eukprot:7103658-Alexandrium_andersonii.AAC.1
MRVARAEGGGPAFCAGALLESLQVQTTDADWKPTYIDRSRSRLSSPSFKIMAADVPRGAPVAP